ncbi:helix-turn-helix transcriptional regulator [Sphaerotilus hippei]|nr:helix-turn-helix domain-containing protein [Sphaerotilus hippei]
MHVVRLMQRHLSARGVEAEIFRRHVGVSEVEFSRPQSRLDVRRFRQARRLVEDTGRLMDFRERVPLAWTEWVSQGWPDLPALWFNSASLGSALQHYVRFRPLISEVDAMKCEADTDTLVLSCTPDARTDANMMSTVSHLLMVRDLIAHYQQCLDQPIAARVELGEVGRPVVAAQCSEIFDMPLSIRSGAREHRIVLQGRDLWAQVQSHHHLCSTWSENALEAQLQALAQTGAAQILARRVEDLIETLWQDAGGGDREVNSIALQQYVAKAMGMSRWTLQRNLASHGLSFTKLLDDLRVRRLPTLLSDPSLSLLNVGSRLGFATQSAFSTYFRSRHGYPPSRDPAWLGRG